MLRRWKILCCLLLSMSPVAAGSSHVQWFTQAAISHLVLSADGAQAAWLDLRDDKVSLRRGSIDDLSSGDELTHIPRQTGLGLYRLASYLLIHSAAADGSQQLTLIDGRDGRTMAKFRLPSPATYSILGLEKSSHSLLIAHDARHYGSPDIFRLGSSDARLELVEQNPGRILSWMVNGDRRATRLPISCCTAVAPASAGVKSRSMI